jgi:pyruvate,water dikinase
LKLDGSGALASEVGGKAAAIDRLVGGGVPVPPAAALSIAAYRAFVAAGQLEQFLARLPTNVDPADLAEDAERVEQAFLDAPMPAELRTAFEEAYRSTSGGRPVAVRSSATAEDLAAASFAGQYRSLLGVGSNGLERAVRLCWASLWAPGARAYRSAQGIGSDNVAMGVLIQRMVLAEHSGVVFTIDPIAPQRGVLRVEVVEGLGEGLVSGAVTPEVFHVRRCGLTPVEEAAPSFVVDVSRHAMDIESMFDSPQDIEWSVEDGSLHILQARPITTGPVLPEDGFDTSPPDGATFTPAGVGEMLPGVLPPLLWTINAPMLEEAFSTLYDALGIHPPTSLGPMLGRFRGRAALNLSLLKAAAQQMPGGSGAEVERQYLGRVFTDEPEVAPRFAARLARIHPAWRALRLRKRIQREAAVFIEATDLAVELDLNHGAASAATLVEYRRRVRDLARMGVRTEVAVAAAAAANYRGLEIALERWLGHEEAPLAAQRLTAGAVQEHAGGCATALSFWDVHCDYCRVPQVARAVYDGPVEETETRLKAVSEEGWGFLEIVHGGLRRAGSTALYAGPTWEEDQDSFWAVLRQCRGLAPDAGPPAWMSAASSEGAEYLVELEHRIRGTRKWRLVRVLTGQIVDIRRRLLRRMVADAATFLRLREAAKSAVLRIGGAERRVDAELARRLVADGSLERPGDERFLADEEFERLARGGDGPDLATIAARRAAFETMLASEPLPDLFSGMPGLPEPAAVPEGDLLRGWATSPGRVVGTARIVRSLREGRDLVRGEVLVGRSTDPSWTPLFLIAAGIVLEEGGPLSHAAIVAREFRLPAVLNVKGATRRITSGMTIAVDGTRGTVEILADAEPSPQNSEVPA